ncbi:probable DNA polymerase epsilon catalytic subunit A [Zygosaccharomyces bailii]|nr:probable DNA polymerase epsilon catalytic subunit A [Zygosaccharomyces bailii]
MSNTRFGGSSSDNYAVTAQQLTRASKIDEIDSMMGYESYIPPQHSGRIDLGNLDVVPGRVGWLNNMHPTMVTQEAVSGESDFAGGISAVDYYFLDEEGGSFKSTVTYNPYFFVKCADDTRVNEVEEFLKKYLESCIKEVNVVQKKDLKLDNHLLGLERSLIKLTFVNSNQLFEARKLLRPILTLNDNNKGQKDTYTRTHPARVNGNRFEDAKLLIEDIREYDVPFHVRVSIDKDIRVGKWYKVTSAGLIEYPEKVAFADPVVLAFDIETTKAPLKFPDAAIDQIMMISYMIDGEGFLITNREIISEDIEDFEYSPTDEFLGQFTIFNEADEMCLLQRFFEHIKDVRPSVISTFNGDFFDWPFVDNRAKIHGLDLYEEIGFAPDTEGEYKSPYCSHMDCFRWVKRDSYLPQGSQGLKAVTQAKLGYNPIELDPELMTPYAFEQPQQLSEYSVSDAVATYYLYMKYVHPFIFSLCTIIPLNPDEVLRKGTGTLCEMLLTVQAYKGNILLPNKYTDPIERFYDGHLLESETYVGGHVESLEAGVFRKDIKNDFVIDPNTIDNLLEELPKALHFCIEVENKTALDEVTNLEEIEKQIKAKLLDLRNNNKRNEYPLIYHVDVASMYPNIMISNRLQPDSMKTERDCASCDFNRPGKSCDRRMPWAWRGEFFPAKMDEYNMIKRALQNETFPNPNKFSKKQHLTFDELTYAQQVGHIKKRLTDYSKKNYHRIRASEIVEREAIICQRENPFYANTVRSFRDRRYEFKGLAKKWKNKASSIGAADKHAKEEAKKMEVLYDSLQLAHKVILNSFYGYVMRKGSRWYSMEMAGITCLTGATLIQMARALVEKLGTPLELDTDGIWCTIPQSFPDEFTFTLRNGKKLLLSYPCSMLNYKVHQKFTNHQYQDLVDPVKHKYKTHSENSIFFELDGPYRAMVLPTSKEEGKGIKKRYAVFNDDGSLAELKGFELKRRGELQLIKNFQSDLFKVFLEGTTLEECYAAVGTIANRWLDILDYKGSMLEDEDLINLICENKSMSKTLKEYGGQKSTSITTAKRLGEFLGEEMVKDKGLQCKYIISAKPFNAPVTDRAIPVAIFLAEVSVKRSFLRRWTMDMSLEDFDLRNIIDWNYYRERVASVIQKIITIPAALQNVPTPVPRVEHPLWLQKKLAAEEDKFKQTSLNRFFTTTSNVPQNGKIKDIEDLFSGRDDEQGMEKVAKVSVNKKISKRKRAENKKTEESLILPSIMPSMEDDYVSWLSYQKIKWKIQARDKLRRSQLFGNSNNSMERTALGSMIRKQAESYADSTWEILQYKQSSQPGVLDVYVNINDKIQTLKFIIPKTIYVKFKRPPPVKIKHSSMERSNFVLPNSPEMKDTSSQNLYRITLPEWDYLNAIEDSASILNNENIVGVFESSIPPTERAIMELGSSVNFKSNTVGALGRGLQKGFDRKNLTITESERYLSRFSIAISYLLHIPTNIGYEFFIICNSWSDTIQVFALKPSMQSQDISATNLKQLYKEIYSRRIKKLKEYSRFFHYNEDTNFETQSFVDISKLYRKMSSQINQQKEDKGLQFLLMLQSPYVTKLLDNLRILNQVPIIEIAMTELILPQLNWRTILNKKIISNIFSCGPRLSHLVTLSQFSNIPICNLKVDTMGYIIDILYARKLQKEGMVMWWNENSPLADHGGVQRDYDPNMAGLQNDLDFPIINNPGVSEQAVLEIEVSNLTVNTVLGSALINEAEGCDLADADAENDTAARANTSNGAFVEDAFSSGSLVVLRSMLKEWWDGALKEDMIADLLVNSFVNWVQDPDSKLFDNSLRYHVHNLTKKAQLHLINEFYYLGSVVIYSDRSRLLVKTKKYSPETCYAYGQYIIKAVRANPAFVYLDLKIDRYWDILLWMDNYNFGGLACTEIQEKEKQDLKAYSQWQLKKFLPAIYQQEFDDWMMIILDSMTKTKNNWLESKLATQELVQLTTKQNNNAEDVDDGPLTNFTEIFCNPLIKRVQKLYQNQQEFILDPNFAADYAFPSLPGSHLENGNPLLELVKYLCHIMLLSKKTILEVRSLRKNLLKIFELREFDTSSEFKNPSSKLIVSSLLCEYCFFMNSINFCRGDVANFACQKCHKNFDDVLLQEHLIQKFLADVDTYLTQDVRCSRCSKIKQDSMSPHCDCSGSWEGTISKEGIEKKFKVYQQVAHFFHFQLLSNALHDMCT